MNKEQINNLKEVTNVYRTKNYIVEQVIGFMFDDVDNSAIVSTDTYYRRTKQRDAKYVLLFSSRKHIDGKRLPTTMYSREYVD